MLNERIRHDLLLTLEHIEQVADYFSEIKSSDDFVSTRQGRAYYDAILMRLQVIGELLKKGYGQHPDLFQRHNEIQWEEIIRMRDLISHHYDKLQHEIAFDVCKIELPKPQKVIKKIIG